MEASVVQQTDNSLNRKHWHNLPFYYIPFLFYLSTNLPAGAIIFYTHHKLVLMIKEEKTISPYPSRRAFMDLLYKKNQLMTRTLMGKLYKQEGSGHGSSETFPESTYLRHKVMTWPVPPAHLGDFGPLAPLTPLGP